MTSNFEKNVKDNAVCRAVRRYQKRGGMRKERQSLLNIKHDIFRDLMATPVKAKDFGRADLVGRIKYFKWVPLILIFIPFMLDVSINQAYQPSNIWLVRLMLLAPILFVMAFIVPIKRIPLMSCKTSAEKYIAFIKKNRWKYKKPKLIDVLRSGGLFILMCLFNIVLWSYYISIKTIVIINALIIVGTYIMTSTFLCFYVRKHKARILKMFLTMYMLKLQEYQYEENFKDAGYEK
jgi:hypothetical protein